MILSVTLYWARSLILLLYFMWTSVWKCHESTRRKKNQRLRLFSLKNLKNDSDERLKEFHMRDFLLCLHDCLKWLTQLYQNKKARWIYWIYWIAFPPLAHIDIVELLSFSSLDSRLILQRSSKEEVEAGKSEEQWLLSNVVELFMMCTMWTYRCSLSPPL